MNASEKRATLAQLEGCDYTITDEFPEDYACFSGLFATIFRFVYAFIFYDFLGKFDAKALHILRTSPFVKGIAERSPIRVVVWEDE
jgi:hypothetical protein